MKCSSAGSQGQVFWGACFCSLGHFVRTHTHVRLHTHTVSHKFHGWEELLNGVSVLGVFQDNENSSRCYILECQLVNASQFSARLCCCSLSYFLQVIDHSLLFTTITLFVPYSPRTVYTHVIHKLQVTSTANICWCMLTLQPLNGFPLIFLPSWTILCCPCWIGMLNVICIVLLVNLSGYKHFGSGWLWKIWIFFLLSSLKGFWYSITLWI